MSIDKHLQLICQLASGEGMFIWQPNHNCLWKKRIISLLPKSISLLSMWQRSLRMALTNGRLNVPSGESEKQPCWDWLCLGEASEHGLA